MPSFPSLSHSMPWLSLFLTEALHQSLLPLRISHLVLSNHLSCVLAKSSHSTCPLSIEKSFPPSLLIDKNCRLLAWARDSQPPWPETCLPLPVSRSLTNLKHQALALVHSWLKLQALSKVPSWSQTHPCWYFSFTGLPEPSTWSSFIEIFSLEDHCPLSSLP